MAGGPIYKGGIPFYKPGVRFKNNVVVFSGTGVPVNGTSGTYAGKAGKGSLYVDYTNANVYMNTNTLASPTWVLVIAGGGVSAFSSTDNITAFAGGGQGSATVLTTDVNRVTTVATRGDSVALPAAASGVVIWVVNAGANPMAVFPVNGGTDKINGQAANVAVTVIPNEVAIFTAAGASNWQAEIGMGNSGSIPTDIYRDTITAFAGGGQASATLLDSELNRITTVATTGDSVKLPVSAAGMGVFIINHGANDMQVFGSGTDTVDDVATATGVSQMKNSVVFYFCTTAGAWYTEGLSTGFEPSLGLQTLKTAPAVTAFAGGGQASATALTGLLNRVAVVATQGDSVKLPASSVGLIVTVQNSGANAMQVFGAGTDTINGVATATGVSQGINTTAVYVCAVAGNWLVPVTSLWSSTPLALGTAAPAVPPNVPHTYVFNRAGVVAATIAAPTAGAGFDGNEIQFTSDSAFAHTITFTGGTLDSGSGAVTTATLNAFKGSSLQIMAFNGRWKVLNANGVAFS